jgi:hypothetical protein
MRRNQQVIGADQGTTLLQVRADLAQQAQANLSAPGKSAFSLWPRQPGRFPPGSRHSLEGVIAHFDTVLRSVTSESKGTPDRARLDPEMGV